MKNEIEKLLTQQIKLDFQVLAGSQKMREKAKRVEDMILWVINDRRLREYILYFTQKDGTPAFAQTDKSRLWHLRQFVEANERGFFRTDYKWDLQLKFYYKKFTRVIGFTNRDSVVINTNTKYVNSSEVTDINMAINNIHEMCHIYGMEHSYKWSHLWPETGPYAIGNYAGYLIRNFYKTPGNQNPEIIDDIPVKIPTVWRRIKLFFRRLF